jgi:hypothetical protein
MFLLISIQSGDDGCRGWTAFDTLVTPLTTGNHRRRERQEDIADEEGAEDGSVFRFTQ